MFESYGGPSDLGPPDLGPADLGEGGYVPAVTVGLAALERIERDLGLLSGIALWRAHDDELRELVLTHARLQAAFDHAGLRLLAALDARPGSVPGAAAGRQAATFLVATLNASPAVANRSAAAAKALHPRPEVDPAAGSPDVPEFGSVTAAEGMPELSTAYAAGDVTRDHVDVVVSVCRRIPLRLLRATNSDGFSGLAQVDHLMTDLSRRLPPRSVDAAAKHLLSILDPDRAENFDADADQRRELTYRHDQTGMLVGRFQLDPLSGLVVTTAINAFSAQPPGSCTGDGAAAAGDDAQPDGGVVLPDTRSRLQRQADSLVAMARAALKVGPNVSGDRPHILICATPEQVLAAQVAASPDAPVRTSSRSRASLQRSVSAEPSSVEARGVGGTGVSEPGVGEPGVGEPNGRLAVPPPSGWARGEGGTPISPKTLGALLCDSVLIRVLRANSGAVLDLGRSVRTATAGQRKALAARDGGCVVPGCTVPASGCEAHHVTWWSQGGPTNIGTMALACPRHHANFHQGHWSIVMQEGLPWVRPPRWADPQRRLLRNTSHEVAGRAIALGEQLLLAVESPSSGIPGRRPPEDPLTTPRRDDVRDPGIDPGGPGSDPGGPGSDPGSDPR
jgi:hypothetical protein